MAFITGTNLSDSLVGTADADIITGLGGDDFIRGGPGDDAVFGGDGSDRALWNGPADGSDFIDGGSNLDELAVGGTAQGEVISAAFGADRAVINYFREDIPIAPQVTTASIEGFTINPGAGSDTVFVNPNLGTVVDLVNIFTFGDRESDTVEVQGPASVNRYDLDLSSQRAALHYNTDRPVNVVAFMDGVDRFVLNGSPTQGDLFAVLDAGNASIRGGGGNDVFSWDQFTPTATPLPGALTLVFDGGAGRDLVATADDETSLGASGGQAFLSHFDGRHVAQLVGVEAVQIQPLMVDGRSAVTIGDLTGTGIAEVRILPEDAGVLTLDVQAGAASETIVGRMAFGARTIEGAPAALRVDQGPVTISLSFRGGGGDDTLDFSQLDETRSRLSLFGDAGADRLIGGRGADNLAGGSGSDILTGGAGGDDFRFDATDPNHGEDVVTDFTPHGAGAASDLIVLSGVASFDELSLRPSGDDTLVIHDGDVLLRLVGVGRGALDASDFVFG